MDYRPQSPDLSTLYAPQSPDLSGLKTQSPLLQSPHFAGLFGQHYQPQHNRFSSGSYSSHGFGGPVSSSPTSVPQFQPPRQESYNYDFPQPTVMARAMKKELHDDDWMADAHDVKRAYNGQQPFGPNLPDATLGVHLKTSFPVARIKRIMQADEDIGKVAQVTPHVVSRALELFMIRLITASAEQANGGAAGGKGPKKIQAQHMKRAIQGNENFDFLNEIAVKVPDAPAKATKKQEADSDTEETKPRKKSTSKKRKGSGDDV